MGIEWQVVANQRNAMLHQFADTLTFHACDGFRLAFPKIAMMHHDSIGVISNRGVNQRLTGGDTGDDTPDRSPAIYLQAIWCIVFKGCC